MSIGIIGTGLVGRTLASKLSERGHQVLVANSRGAASVAESLGANLGAAIPSSTAEAFASDVVFLAVPWIKVRDVLASSGPRAEHILVDTTNIFLSYPPNARIDDLEGDSGSEIIARLVPQAHVVKAFNTLPFATMFAPHGEGVKRVLFVAGDHAASVNTVASLIRDVGLHPVLLGSLAQAGRQMELGGPFPGLELLTPAKGAA